MISSIGLAPQIEDMPQDHQIIQIGDLPSDDAVKRQLDEAQAQFDRRAAEIRRNADNRAQAQAERYNSRETDVKLPDPSGAVRNFCPHCGKSVRLPQFAAQSDGLLLVIEIYQSGEVRVKPSQEAVRR